MFSLNAHTELTIYSSILYIVVNYLCYDKKASSKFMKLFNIKNKSNMRILCLLLFGVGFYFISTGMVHKKQGFKIGGQNSPPPPTVANAANVPPANAPPANAPPANVPPANVPPAANAAPPPPPPPAVAPPTPPAANAAKTPNSMGRSKPPSMNNSESKNILDL